MTPEDRIASAWDHISDVIRRDEPVPLEGTRMDLFNSIIPNWYSEQLGMFFGDASLAQRVWVAARCQQLNSQQIASMPIVYHGPPSATEPRWVSSPDPNFFPNGIGDAMHCIVDQIYGWGFSCQYITGFYDDGFGRTWTVLPSERMDIRIVEGRREYRLGEMLLDPRRVMQIDRNPSLAAHGTSAIRAYAQIAYGLLAAGNQAMNVNQGGIPGVYLKPQRKQTAEQAGLLQADWMAATSTRNGGIPVVPFDIDVMELSINPSDLALLETQEFDAKALATAYGVPAPLLNMALQGGLTYQNPAALTENWWRTELRNTATKIMNSFSARLLPAGQWVSVDARDMWIALDPEAAVDDEQLSQVAKASPAQQKTLTAIGGGGQ